MPSLAARGLQILVRGRAGTADCAGGSFLRSPSCLWQVEMVSILPTVVFVSSLPPGMPCWRCGFGGWYGGLDGYGRFRVGVWGSLGTVLGFGLLSRLWGLYWGSMPFDPFMLIPTF